jgi:hypothetical protein
MSSSCSNSSRSALVAAIVVALVAAVVVALVAAIVVAGTAD